MTQSYYKQQILKQIDMTVQELIDELQMFDDETEVKVQTDLGQYSIAEVEGDEDLEGDKVSIYLTRMTDDI